MIEGYRRMTPQQELQRVLDLNRAAESLARARIRHQYGPDLTEREENLRLASLYLDREAMIRASSSTDTELCRVRRVQNGPFQSWRSPTSLAPPVSVDCRSLRSQFGRQGRRPLRPGLSAGRSAGRFDLTA